MYNDDCDKLPLCLVLLCLVALFSFLCFSFISTSYFNLLTIPEPLILFGRLAQFSHRASWKRRKMNEEKKRKKPDPACQIAAHFGLVLMGTQVKRSAVIRASRRGAEPWTHSLIYTHTHTQSEHARLEAK
jgi:hypothetical protein